MAVVNNSAHREIILMYNTILNMRISKIAFCVWCKKTVEKVGYPSYSKTGHTGEDDVPNANS